MEVNLHQNIVIQGCFKIKLHKLVYLLPNQISLIRVNVC